MTLRRSLFKAFFIMQILFFVIGVFFVALSFLDGQDHINDAMINAEVEGYIERYRLDPQAPMPNGSSFSSYIDTVNMPLKHRQLVQNLAVGSYELEVDGMNGFDDEREFKVKIAELPPNGNTIGTPPHLFYFISDISEAQQEQLISHNIGFLLITYFFSTFLLGSWLSRLFSKRIALPLERITRSIRNSKTNAPLTDLRPLYAYGEIGILARNIDEKNQRIAQFIQRENDITRNISHELRTPITIVKSSISILKLPANQDAYQAVHTKTLNKIERAANDMEAIVETFLLLGREMDPADALIDGSAITERVISDHLFMLDNDNVKLKINIERQVSLACHEQVFSVAIANLIRNALQHTQSGSIAITLTNQAFAVIDTGSGIDAAIINKVTDRSVKGESSNGYGLGLHIVQQICEQMHWQLQLCPNPSGQGVIAQIAFK